MSTNYICPKYPLGIYYLYIIRVYVHSVQNPQLENISHHLDMSLTHLNFVIFYLTKHFWPYICYGESNQFIQYLLQFPKCLFSVHPINTYKYTQTHVVCNFRKPPFLLVHRLSDLVLMVNVRSTNKFTVYSSVLDSINSKFIFNTHVFPPLVTISFNGYFTHKMKCTCTMKLKKGFVLIKISKKTFISQPIYFSV